MPWINSNRVEVPSQYRRAFLQRRRSGPVTKNGEVFLMLFRGSERRAVGIEDLYGAVLLKDRFDLARIADRD